MRALLSVLALSLLVLVAAAPSPAQPAPSGTPVLAFDVLPRTLEGRVVVPLRAVFEWVGARVEFSGGRITAFQGDSTVPRVTLTIGDRAAQLSGSPYQLEVPPVAVAGRTFVPLRFVAEAFGVWVSTEGRTIRLQRPQDHLDVSLAIPPAEGSHLAKVWMQIARFYDRPDVAQMAGALPHWNLYSEAQKARLIAETGTDAPTVIEAHWGGRGLEGIRIVADELNVAAGKAQLDVLVKWEGGETSLERFNLVLQRTGWRVDGTATLSRDGHS